MPVVIDVQVGERDMSRQTLKGCSTCHKTDDKLYKYAKCITGIIDSLLYLSFFKYTYITIKLFFHFSIHVLLLKCY